MRFNIVIIFLLLSLSSCIVVNIDNETSSTIFEKGEFVEIQKEYIIRGSKDHGTHRYNYVRNKNTLSLAMGNKFIIWEIILLNKQELQLKVDFGLFILKR